MVKEMNETIILVTGANSGLGLCLAQRLVSEFLNSSPITNTLQLIFTTRSKPKSASTHSCLLKHIAELERNGHNDTGRVRFTSYEVDLTDLVSVISLAKTLRSKHPKVDVAIFNAGMGAFTGINWLRCFTCLALDWINAVTYPDYKMQAVGWTKKQNIGSTESKGTPGAIGDVFCANVFGHYYLAHEIMPLLNKGESGSGDIAGRVVWVSSLEAYEHSFDVDDIEGLKATHSYESSKRLTDVLSLTSSMPYTKQFTDTFFNTDDIIGADPEISNGRKVKFFLTHPGICATSIVPLHILLWWGMTLAFYIARWLGSPWHVVEAWNGATSMCTIALASNEELEETNAQKIKWGSATDFWGKPLVKSTEVEGDTEEEWEVTGKLTWKRLEALRKEWKSVLEA